MGTVMNKAKKMDNMVEDFAIIMATNSEMELLF